MKKHHPNTFFDRICIFFENENRKQPKQMGLNTFFFLFFLFSCKS